MSEDSTEQAAEIVRLRTVVDQLEGALQIAAGRSEHLQVINDFAVAILSHKSLDKILHSVIHNAIANLGFEDCVIYLLDDDGNRLVRRAAYGPQRPTDAAQGAAVLAVGQGIVGAVAASGQLLNVADTRNDARYLVDDAPRLSELAVPIVHSGRVIGVIDTEHPQVGYYGESHERILTTVASIASTSIASALGYMRLQTTVGQLREAERMQATLHEIARLANSRLDMDVFYRLLHQAVATLLYSETFYIALYDRQSDVCQFVYVVDEVDEAHPNTGDEWPRERLAGGLTDYVIRTGKALLATPSTLTTLEAEGRVRALGRRPVDWLGVPLTRGREVIGVLAVQSYDEAHRYRTTDKEVLLDVSQHISMALETRRIEAKLRRDALVDAITGLPNRRDFVAQVQQILSDPVMPAFAVLLFGLNRFKVLNDSLGHDVGDRVLMEIAGRLRRPGVDNYLAARIGGDEFAILLRDHSRDQVMQEVEAISADLERVVLLDERQLRTSSSVGIVLGDSSYETAEAVLRDAYAALHQAKVAGRERIAVFDQSMRQNALHLLELESDLRQAIALDEFVVHYQPIVALDDLSIVGFEALARWRHPSRGELLPCDFIQRAHDTGLLTKLDWCVLRIAGRDLSAWHAAFPTESEDVRVSVNLSSHHFHLVGFAERVRRELDSAGVDARSIVLEITEHTILDELPRVNTELDQLRTLGIGLSVDDFGTGYSSLSYLHQLSVDALKIDRSFVARIGTDVGSEAIVRAILALADALGLRVIAEGIETPIQHATLRAMGCRHGQGFFYSRPVDAAEALALIQKRHLR